MEFFFILKHFVCDFILQRPYQYLNKGTYGHTGGILHAFIHGIGTLVVLIYFGVLPINVWYAVWFDMVTHYHIDWAKVNVCKKFNLTATNSEVYWILLGFDQFLHFVVYYIIWSSV